jgi:hypothetical protein
MDSTWPFFVILIGLLTGLGIMIANIDRANIINNWTSRRCDIPVMFASFFFKPESDPRTKTDFAVSNFEFCMKSYVDTFMAKIMAPLQVIFSKQLNVAGNAANMMNTLRSIAQNLFSVFSGYLEQFYRRFNSSVFEISRVVQFLRMAMRRISGILMTLVYAGISLFNGILNAIQFVIKVILIICGIMIVLMIILFFILFPVIPIILYTLVIIVKSVIPLAGIIDPGVASDAESKKGGFCFAEWTEINVIRNGQQTIIPIHQVKVGDILATTSTDVTAVTGTIVTAIIHMDGTDVPLYRIGSVYVSGSHLIRGTDEIWKSVSEDERAIRTDAFSKTVYCFNTTTNIIRINGLEFRDWEEIANDDEKGQIIWNYMISSQLNRGKPYQSWKENLKNYVNMALMSKSTYVKCEKGFVPLECIRIGDNVIDHEGNAQKVLGIIWGGVEADKEHTPEEWVTELYEYNDIWIKERATIYPGVDVIEGMALITEDGECMIWDSVQKKEKRIRDFTEIGYNELYKTYSYVDARLRIKE